MQLPESYNRMMEKLLEDYPAYRDSLSRPSERGLRLNTLKIKTPKERERVLSVLFGGAAPERIPWSPDGYYVPADAAISEHPYYQAGLYYLQEPSAQAPAAELPVRPGDRVLDLCAAPGGKSTQLLAKLEGEGVLVANDPSAGRAAALRKNLELFGAKNAFVTVEEPERLAASFAGYFDAILVDAPCSGSGMFRRDPMMAAFYESNGPKTYVPEQARILEAAVSMLRPGGSLLYSTCTFAPEEDEEQVLALLRRHPELSPKPLTSTAGFGAGPELLPKDSRLPEPAFCARLYPHRVRGDGQFLALLQKNGEPGEPKGVRSGKTRLHEAGNCIYLLPERSGPLPPLRYLMTGLCLAHNKKGRLQPTQALSMALRGGEWPKTLELPAEDERIVRYLKGESVFLKPGDVILEGNAPGWLPDGIDRRSLLVTVDGYPLGFAKDQNGLLKNLRDPGWRIAR